MQVCCFLILSLQISLLYLKLLDLFTFDGEMQHICSVLFFSRTQRRTDPRGNWGSREQYRETFSQARERGNFWNVQIQYNAFAELVVSTLLSSVMGCFVEGFRILNPNGFIWERNAWILISSESQLWEFVPFVFPDLLLTWCWSQTISNLRNSKQPSPFCLKSFCCWKCKTTAVIVGASVQLRWVLMV